MVHFPILLEKAKEISSCESQEEKLELILSYASELEMINEESKTIENKVPGCVSQVYITCKLDKNGLITCFGSSDALIIKGYIAIVLLAIKNKSKEEILSNLKSEVQEFLSQTKLISYLSPTRAHATISIIEFILKKVTQIKIPEK
jgi:cysteine desulfuration protein SufE